jgi:hypothetical protein
MPLAFEWWIALVFFVGIGPAIDTTSYSTAIANRSEFTIVVAPVDSKRIPAIGQIGGSQARALAPGNHASQYSIHNAPAYWSGTVYVAVSGGPLMALQLSGGLLPVNGGTAIAASQSAETYGYTPPTPTISYSPSGNAIVWAARFTQVASCRLTLRATPRHLLCPWSPTAMCMWPAPAH